MVKNLWAPTTTIGSALINTSESWLPETLVFQIPHRATRHSFDHKKEKDKRESDPLPMMAIPSLHELPFFLPPSVVLPRPIRSFSLSLQNTSFLLPFRVDVVQNNQIYPWFLFGHKRSPFSSPQIKLLGTYLTRPSTTKQLGKSQVV